MALNDQLGNRLGRWLQLILLRVVMKLILIIKITGSKNIPLQGPVILVINHIALLDPVMVIGVVSRRVIPMTKIEVLSLPIIGWLAKVYGCIPVRRGQADTRAFKQALAELKKGNVILIAPEGTRSQTGQLQPAKDGATLLALRSRAPIVPIGITGTHRVKDSWIKFKQPVINLSIGKAFTIGSTPEDHSLPRDKISQLTKKIMCHLAAQLPPEFRGIYAETSVVNT